MKKNFFSLLLCTICGTLLISCENDNATSGRSPVFEKIVLTPNPCETGDTIQGVVSYTSAGQHIYKTTYYVRVVGSTTSGDSIFHKQTWMFLIPRRVNLLSNSRHQMLPRLIP